MSEWLFRSTKTTVTRCFSNMPNCRVTFRRMILSTWGWARTSNLENFSTISPQDIARLVDLTLNDALNLRACNLGAKAIRRQQNFARRPLKNNKGGTGTITDY